MTRKKVLWRSLRKHQRRSSRAPKSHPTRIRWQHRLEPLLLSYYLIRTIHPRSLPRLSLGRRSNLITTGSGRAFWLKKAMAHHYRPLSQTFRPTRIIHLCGISSQARPITDPLFNTWKTWMLMLHSTIAPIILAQIGKSFLGPTELMLCISDTQ